MLEHFSPSFYGEAKTACLQVRNDLEPWGPRPRLLFDHVLDYSYSTLELRQRPKETEHKRQAWQTEDSRYNPAWSFPVRVGAAPIGNERKSGG
jgi:hypothetical protein